MPESTPAQDTSPNVRRSWPEEIGGAFGDLGTFIPHTLASISVAGLSPVGVFMGFGLFYIVTGLFYKLPIPVQPMKAVSALLLTDGLSPAEIAATGVLIGLVLIVLGLGGIIAHLARSVPQTVSTGLQLGLGISLARLSLEMMSDEWWLGLGIMGLLIVLVRVPRVPATLIALGVALAIARMVEPGAQWPFPEPLPSKPTIVIPGFAELERALRVTVLPQLALTLTNAIILTSAVSHELFAPCDRNSSPSNLALTSGIANLILAPFGALPMCHGAGGLAAHYRFGARTGAAPVIIGITLLSFGWMFADFMLALFTLIPSAAIGALLFFSSIELAWSKRLLDARSHCLPVIGITAAATLAADPLWGLLSGWSIELLAGRFGGSRRNQSQDP